MEKEAPKYEENNIKRDDILNAKQASEYLSIAMPTLYKYVQKGWIAYYRPARKLYFTRSDLDDFMLNEKYYHRSIAQIEEEFNMEYDLEDILS